MGVLHVTGEVGVVVEYGVKDLVSVEIEVQEED